MKCLYMLSDPRGLAQCYIGITGDLKRRYQNHLGQGAINGERRKVFWIQSLLALGLKPGLVVLDEGIPDDEALQAEEDAIAMCRAIRGDACLNGRHGRPRVRVNAPLIVELRRQKHSWSRISKETGLSSGTVRRAFFSLAKVAA